MAIEREPPNAVPKDYVPPGYLFPPYKVKDGDDWQKVAAKFGVDTDGLIRFNFDLPKDKPVDKAVVNWYLRVNVGCKDQTSDKANWMFTSRADPGLIYIAPP